MKGTFQIKDSKFEVDFSKGNDISIPLCFNGEQPNTYGVDKATSSPYQDGQFIGDTRKGGPCNFETYSFTPHCNGTHTECIGHLTDERISILSCLNEEFIPITLISVTPQKMLQNHYPWGYKERLVITENELKTELQDTQSNFMKGIIIRTLPNSTSKKNRDYMKETPPYLNITAVEYLVSLGIQHLLVDTPSVDPLLDNGRLTAHNSFWETKDKKNNPNTKGNTITEMIFVPDHVEDGAYLLNLQIPAFVSDAAPSRPILYKINEL